MEEKAIGVVAGVGPFAGLDLMRKIAEQTIAPVDQDHVTVLSVSRPSTIPDRTEYLQGRVAENPARPIVDQLLLLAQMGASVAGIPCNTAHAPRIYDAVRALLTEAGCALRLLHMVDEVGAFLQERRPHLRCVGVLSTTGTYEAAIYPKRLRALGYTAVVPTPMMQTQQIHPAIYDPVYGIKACGLVTAQAEQALRAGISALRAQGAEAVILGCTEIPLAISERAVDGVLLIDPTLILARALIRDVDSRRLRPFT